MLTRALTALTLALATNGGMASATTPATCSITGGPGDAAAPCEITWRGGGSLTATMTGTTPRLMLDILPSGEARVSVDPPGPAPLTIVGTVRRDPADAACWSGEGFRACFRATDAAAVPPGGTGGGTGGTGVAPGVPAPVAPGVPATDAAPTRDVMRFTARCHMDACTWIEQSAPHQIGSGSAAVPGRLFEVTERFARRDYPGGDYPDGVPADAPWQAAQTGQYFCSPIRPAYRDADGSWTVLPLPEVFGATEGATYAYVHVCHPDRIGLDPYRAVEGLGYEGQADSIGETYPDFAALTAG